MEKGEDVRPSRGRTECQRVTTFKKKKLVQLVFANQKSECVISWLHQSGISWQSSVKTCDLSVPIQICMRCANNRGFFTCGMVSALFSTLAYA